MRSYKVCIIVSEFFYIIRVRIILFILISKEFEQSSEYGDS